MPRRATPLTPLRIRHASPDAYPLWDGDGLHLILTPAGERHWRLKYYRPDGRENRLALGNLREVSLAQARVACSEARALVRLGRDPGAERIAAKQAARRKAGAAFPTAAAHWLAKKQPEWALATHRKAKYVVDTYLVPKLRHESVATLGSKEANAALDSVAAVAPELARKARQYLNGILEEAVLGGLRDEGRPLLLRRGTRRHQGHIPAATELKQVRALVRAIEAYPTAVTRAALQLAMYTAMRPGVVASARWEDIDATLAEWHVPGDRMKMRHAHIVSLPRQALGVLAAMRPLTEGGEFVFPPLARQTTPHLHRDSLSAALRRMGFQGKHATHGFRGMLRTVARERLDIDPDVLEAQLAHAKRDEVQKAYDRTTFNQARRKAMQGWADFLDGMKA
jgi:integrase